MARKERTRYKPTTDRKTVRIVTRITPKNEIYLSKLGYLDRRNGSVKNDASKFVNDCITAVCESRVGSGLPMASSEELLQAWIKQQVRVKNEQIAELQAELVALSRKAAEIRAEDRVVINNVWNA